jgi:hypothetical protein
LYNTIFENKVYYLIHKEDHDKIIECFLAVKGHTAGWFWPNKKTPIIHPNDYYIFELEKQAKDFLNLKVLK